MCRVELWNLPHGSELGGKLEAEVGSVTASADPDMARTDWKRCAV